MEIALIVSAVVNIVGGVVLFFVMRELQKNKPPF